MKHKFKRGDLVITKSRRLAFVGIVMSLRERYAEPKNIELVKIYITCVLESSSPRSRSQRCRVRMLWCNTIEEVNIKDITLASALREPKRNNEI